MDHFGIGAGMTGAARIYLQAARQTGRTESLIDSVKDGDRIVCALNQETERLKRMLLDRGRRVEVITVSPEDPRRIFERGTSEGRTLFDHTWVEQFYLNVLSRAENEIDHLQKESSGFGAAHIKTRFAAMEINKWSG